MAAHISLFCSLNNYKYEAERPAKASTLPILFENVGIFCQLNVNVLQQTLAGWRRRERCYIEPGCDYYESEWECLISQLSVKLTHSHPPSPRK